MALRAVDTGLCTEVWGELQGWCRAQGLKRIINPKTTVTLGMGKGERWLLGHRELSGEGLRSRAVVFNQGHVRPVVTHPSVREPRGSTVSSLSSRLWSPTCPAA